MTKDNGTKDTLKNQDNYSITEKDILPTVSDFETFYSYIISKKAELTKNRQELGKKACYEINSLLTKPRNLEGPKYLQPTYPTINLFFSIILNTGLFAVESGKTHKLYLVPTDKLKIYEDLDIFSKYMLLFKAYWTSLDFEELYFDSSSMFHHFMYTKMAFEKLALANPWQRIFVDLEDFENNYDRFNPIHRLFVSGGLIVHHLSVFGFWDYEEAHIQVFSDSKKDIRVKSILPTDLGISMIRGCRQRPYELYNKYTDKLFIDRNWRDDTIRPIVEKLGLTQPTTDNQNRLEPFETVFKPYFPQEILQIKAMDDILEMETLMDTPQKNNHTLDHSYEDEEMIEDELREETMMNVLVNMTAEVEKMKAKRESKLWKEISPPFSLGKLLRTLTKDELTAIRQKLEIQGASSLNKAQLISVLEKKIVSSAKKVIQYYVEDQFNILMNVLKYDGTGHIEMTLEHIEEFKKAGLIFPCILNGNRVLIIPEELKCELWSLEKDVNLQNIIKRNTKWVRLAQGLLYYYGALQTRVLMEMIGTHVGTIELRDTMDFFMVMNNAQDYYGAIKTDVGVFCNSRVFDWRKVLTEHQNRDSLSYYSFTYQQLYQAGGERFVDKNPAYKRFVKFIRENYDISQEEAESLVEECVFAIRIEESFQDIINFLQRHLEIPSFEFMQEFMEHLMFLHNNTRQWNIKGYMPSELSQGEKQQTNPLETPKLRLVVNNDKKNLPGRNEPCACGSGKKYKKCCGR